MSAISLKASRSYAQALMILILLTMLVACAQLGLTGPQNFTDKTYAAAATVEQVQKTAATLRNAGKISQADAVNTLKATDAAVEAIAVARAYAATNPQAANTKLESAIAALTLLQSYLATQGAK